MHAGVPTLPSMSRSPKPEIGGGGPVHSARTTLLGPDRGEQKLPLSDDEEAAARGTVLQERIRAAIARDDDRGIRDLARIVEECRDLASRSPELEDYVAFLARRGREGAVKRILGQTRRGRRLESQGLLVGALLGMGAGMYSVVMAVDGWGSRRKRKDAEDEEPPPDEPT